MNTQKEYLPPVSRYNPPTHTWDCGCKFKRVPKTTGERFEDWEQTRWCKSHTHLNEHPANNVVNNS